MNQIKKSLNTLSAEVSFLKESHQLLLLDRELVTKAAEAINQALLDMTSVLPESIDRTPLTLKQKL